MHSEPVQVPRRWEGGDVLKPVPHQHPGEAAECWNRYCDRVTTSDKAAQILNGAVLGAFVGPMLSRNRNAAVAGAIIGALLGSL